MLAIRLQRYGKTHFAVYRIVVQDAARSSHSGKVVAYVGNYNPHTKAAEFDRDLVAKYLNSGAQPSPRVAKLLGDAGVKLPDWVKKADSGKQRTTRNPEKLRKNQPKEAPAAEVATPAETAVAEDAKPAETDKTGETAE